MEWLLQNPLALWMVIGAAFLVLEVATGSGWLLWPAGAAAVTGIVVQGFHLDLTVQLVLFAALTILTTLAGRRFFPRFALAGSDINDTSSRLVGSIGLVAEPFQDGHGRVFVDGKEWAAELDGGGVLALGAKVSIVSAGSARLTVRSV